MPGGYGPLWQAASAAWKTAISIHPLENLARYILRASFSQERMTYIPSSRSGDAVPKVIYWSKDGTRSKTFYALDWLAQLTTHIPDRHEQTVRHYGYHSNR